MTQYPIGSGFGAHSTAADVLAGLDLAGRTAVVTGGHSGIGLATTRALAAAGARVVVLARRPEAARDVLADLPVDVDELDLADQGSVAAFARRYVDSGRPLDVLVGNAGIMACPETRIGPGWEAQFGVNHLGHHALANLLWPALVRNGGRVVAVSSLGHHRTPIRWDDVMWTRDRYEKFAAYGQSKTANALFAVELDRRGREHGVRAFAVHPGAVFAPLQYVSREEQIASGWIKPDGSPGDFPFKTPEQAAATQVWAATSLQLDGMGGLYLEDVDVAPMAVDRSRGVRDYAVDPEQAARLWTLSAELTGVDVIPSG